MAMKFSAVKRAVGYGAVTVKLDDGDSKMVRDMARVHNEDPANETKTSPSKVGEDLFKKGLAAWLAENGKVPSPAAPKPKS